MTGRRKAPEAAGLIAQVAVLIVLVSLYFPAVRQALAEPGFMTLSAEILLVAILAGCGVYRLATREGGLKDISGNPFAASRQNWSDSDSETIPDFLYPMLRRQYPWRH